MRTISELYLLDEPVSFSGTCKIFQFTPNCISALISNEPYIEWVKTIVPLGVKREGLESAISFPHCAKPHNA
jgi:hypothetical protein